MPITTIIFDFAGVLVSETSLRLEEQFGYDAMTVAEKKKYIRALHLSETGKMTSRELLHAMHETLLKSMSVNEIKEVYLSSKLMPPWELLQKLKDKYRVLILSNHQKKWPAIIGKRLGVNFLSVPFINSSHIGMRKPFLKMFKYVEKKYKITGEEILFIDDREQNIEGAQEAGWHTFHYKDNFKDLTTYLKKKGIEGL